MPRRMEECRSQGGASGGRVNKRGGGRGRGRGARRFRGVGTTRQMSSWLKGKTLTRAIRSKQDISVSPSSLAPEASTSSSVVAATAMLAEYSKNSSNPLPPAVLSAAATLAEFSKSILNPKPPVAKVEIESSSGSSTPAPPSPSNLPAEPKVEVSLSRPTSIVRGPAQRRSKAFVDTHFYGSDVDSDEDDREDEVLQPLLVSREMRQYCSTDENSDEEEPLQVLVEPSWPPAFPVAIPRSIPRTEPAASRQDKFNFQWKPFPQCQIDPTLRREPFSEIRGPTVSYAEPYEAFTAIWDRPIMEYIAKETNRYAQQLAARMMVEGTIGPRSRITKWVDTTADELYTYFAVILATGIVVKSRLEEYWSSSKDIFGTPGFAAAMSHNRFYLLSKCLHFNNNDLCTRQTMSDREAKLFKVLPIVEDLNKKFTSLYVLGRNIALDESLTKWTGCLNIRQRIPNKTGIKTYEICETETGYLWRFVVESRQSSPNPQESSPISGRIPTMVLKLLNGLEHKGHTVWMDSYYNSPALARELKLKGFDCAGTLRTNRQFVPAELANSKTENLAPGQVYGCTSGDVDIIVWRDKKCVALLSTYHGLSTIKRNDVTKPAIVHDYNIQMGGVDKKDQMLAMYPLERKRTAIWYKKLFRRLLNASVFNSYILLSRPMTHRNFRRTLIIQLLERHSTYSEIPPAPELKRHSPLLFDYENSVKGFRRLRRKCGHCSKRTTSYCEGCSGLPLCVPTCFSQYHSSS